MYSTLSHCSQETFSTENVLTGRGPHRRLEHLLTDWAVEIIFRVGRVRRKLLGHGEGWKTFSPFTKGNSLLSTDFKS